MGILCRFYNEYSEVNLTRILYKDFEKPAKGIVLYNFIVMEAYDYYKTTICSVYRY